MYDELTEVDIKKMQEEIDHRIKVVRPKCIEDVQIAREFGDLSENFEYKAAKREKNHNESRIRYLEKMIKTAKLIKADSAQDVLGLFDTAELLFEEDGEIASYKLVTTLRQNSLKGLLSKESPLGKAILGRRAGERVLIEVDENYSYYVVIKSITKGNDDESLPISIF